MAIKDRVLLAFIFACIGPTMVAGQLDWGPPLEYKQGAAGTIFERHFAEYDILNAALDEAWGFAERKKYAKAQELLAAAIAKLYKSPKTPRYIEERAIEENYLGRLIVADSGLSFAQGKVQEAFNKFYAGDTLVSYALLLDPAHRGETVDPGFLDFIPFNTSEDVVRYCFMATRMKLLSGPLEVTKQEWLVAPVADFQLYFDKTGKCTDKDGFEKELIWYLENMRDFFDDLVFLSNDDVEESSDFKKIIDEYIFRPEINKDTYFAIMVKLKKDRAYKFIEQYYGLR